MSITLALSNALSGLTANARLAEITSGNLANALTDGYGRQSVTLTTQVLGGQGNGVKVSAPQRALDPELTSARRIADGDLNAVTPQFTALDGLETALGKTGGEDQGLLDQIGTLESALRQFSDSPESSARQQAVAQAASDVAAKFNQISSQTAAIRQSADDEIARQVQTVNSNLQKIARLNRQIQIFSAGGRDTASLIDQRERLVDEVAAIVPIRSSQRDDGVLELRTAQGLQLADTRAQQIDFTATPVIAAGQSFDNGNGALSGLRLNGVDITPGGTGAQVITSGALVGQFAVRDQIAPTFQTQIDTLAADLIGRFADTSVDATLAVGAPGLFTDLGNAFDPADLAGLASRLKLNALVDPAQGGDVTLLRDGLGATSTGPVSNDTLARGLLDALTRRDTTTVPGLSGSKSVIDQISELGQLVATDRVRAESDVSSLTAAREGLSEEEGRRLGVDSDAELQALIQIEQAYSANTQVIKTAQRLLDDLLRI